jgi:hypothetical protein
VITPGNNQAEIKAIKDDLKIVRDPWVRRELRRRVRELEAEDAWNEQAEPCTGSGFSHKPHGACTGYSTDRT